MVKTVKRKVKMREKNRKEKSYRIQMKRNKEKACEGVEERKTDRKQQNEKL